MPCSIASCTPRTASPSTARPCASHRKNPPSVASLTPTTPSEPLKPSMGAAVRDHRNAVRDQSESLSAINRNTCPQSPESADYAKANPGKVSYSSPGTGSTNHLIVELLKLQAGIPDLIHVPYRGIGPALTDLTGGQIPMIIPTLSGTVLEFQRARKLRIIAVASPKRLAGTPELPTAAE